MVLMVNAKKKERKIECKPGQASSISFSKEERSSLSSSSEDESLFEKEMKAWPAQRRKRK
jgi:hypothetical protein